MEIKIITLVVCGLLVIAAVHYCFSTDSSRKRILGVNALATTISGKVPLNVSFSYEYFNSEENVKSVLWNFGDGNTSENRSANHTYQKSGYYQVDITLYDHEGLSVSDKMFITVLDLHPPFVSISVDDSCGKAPFTVSFTSNAYDIDGEVVTYEWDFGDGSVSLEPQVTYTYTQTGRYFARLTVTDNDGMQHSDTIQINVIENYPPVAFASSDVTRGKTPLLVNFYADSKDIDGEDISYRWVVEGTFLESNREKDQQNMAHRFWLPGVYNVTLTVTDEDGATDSSMVRITVRESIFSWALRLVVKNIISNVIDTNTANSIGNWIGEFIANRLI
jgi:large repetitive protein